MMRVVYLKVNRMSDYCLPCVKYWIDVFNHDKDVKVYFLCDRDDMKKYIEQSVPTLKFDYEWIISEREDPDMKFIVERMTIPVWNNAGYAHMTTFYHSAKNGFDSFWNIDADDMRFFVSYDKALKVFDEVEKVADENEIHAFSIDLWPTLSQGKHWSFGLTYCRNTSRVLTTLKNTLSLEQNIALYNAMVTKGRNVDWFFTFLRLIQSRQKQSIIKIDSFYVENLQFAHHLPDFYMSYGSSIRVCKDGRYHIPMFANDYGMGEDGSIPINDEVYKIDVGLTDKDAYDYFQTESDNAGKIKDFKEINQMLRIPETDIKISVVLYQPEVADIHDLIIELTNETYRNFEFIVLDFEKNYLALEEAQYQKYSFAGSIKTIKHQEFFKNPDKYFAKGSKYIFFTDARQNFKPEAFEKLLNYAEKYNTDVLQPAKVENTYKVNQSQESRKRLWLKNTVPIHGQFINREFFKQIKSTPADEYEFALELLFKAQNYFIIPNDIIDFNETGNILQDKLDKYLNK